MKRTPIVSPNHCDCGVMIDRLCKGCAKYAREMKWRREKKMEREAAIARGERVQTHGV